MFGDTCNLCATVLEVDSVTREPITWLPELCGFCCRVCSNLVKDNTPPWAWDDDYECFAPTDWRVAYTSIYIAMAPVRALAQARATFRLKNLGVMLARKALERNPVDSGDGV